MVDDPSIVQPGELGLSQQAFNYLNVKEGALVTVNHAEPPKSMDAVRRKINGVCTPEISGIYKKVGKSQKAFPTDL